MLPQPVDRAREDLGEGFGAEQGGFFAEKLGVLRPRTVDVGRRQDDDLGYVVGAAILEQAQDDAEQRERTAIAFDMLAAVLEQPRFDAACKAVGRDRASVEISCMWIPAMEGLDIVEQYQALGVDRLIIPLQTLGGPPLEALDKLGSEMLSKMP